ncbi:MAG: hypothetical protein QGI41_09075 [Acidimicrobiales bacterium]|nr:hypothetical protein [Acidimicrobiales bacterium]
MSPVPFTARLAEFAGVLAFALAVHANEVDATLRPPLQHAAAAGVHDAVLRGVLVQADRPHALVLAGLGRPDHARPILTHLIGAADLDALEREAPHGILLA